MKVFLLLVFISLFAACDTAAKNEQLYLYQSPQSVDQYFQSTLFRIQPDSSVFSFTFDTNLTLLHTGKGHISATQTFPCYENNLTSSDNLGILINLSHPEFCKVDTQLIDVIEINDSDILSGRYVLILEMPKTVTKFDYDASLIEKAHRLIPANEFFMQYPKLSNRLQVNNNPLVFRSKQRYFQAFLLTYKEH